MMKYIVSYNNDPIGVYDTKEDAIDAISRYYYANISSHLNLLIKEDGGYLSGYYANPHVEYKTFGIVELKENF